MNRCYSNESQIRWACLMLIKGREISHAHEIAAANGWRLGAIIHNLKKKYNWPIQARYGERGIAYYRLSRDVDSEALKKPRSFLKKEKGGLTPPNSKRNK
jgi:intergrase/recombinase